MFWRLTLFLLLFPAVELLILRVLCDSIFGFLLVLTVMSLTAILGAGLLTRQGLRCWRELEQRLDRNEAPTATLLNGNLLMIAGALLMTPGPISDLFGLLLLLPPVRALVIAHLLLRFEAGRGRSRPRNDPDKPDVIDV